MDRDFHYYGTYLAAHAAGFDNKSARIIATSAQYIDDCTEAVTYKSGTFGWSQHKYKVKVSDEKSITFRPMVTSVYGMVTWSLSSSYDETRQIWMPFHFLPGNYKGQTSTRVELRDGGKMTAEQASPRSDFDEHDDILCRPRSDTAHDMINFVKEEYQRLKAIDETLALMLIGSCMHVFADTYAHQDFAGTCSVRLNGTRNEIGKNKGKFTVFGKWDGLKWHPDVKTFRDIDWPTDVASWDPINTYSTASTRFSDLGHGQMGHIPDVSTVAFEYEPNWSKEPVLRNNPQQYITGFIDMISAMKAIKAGTTFDWFANESAETSFYQTQKPLVDKVKQAIAPDSKMTHDSLIYDLGLKVDQREWFLNSETRWANLVESECGSLAGFDGVPGFNESKLNWHVAVQEAQSKAEESGTEINRPDFIGFDFIKWNCATKLLFRNTYMYLRNIGNGRARMLRARKLSEDMNPTYCLIDEIAELWKADDASEPYKHLRSENEKIMSCSNSDRLDMVMQLEYRKARVQGNIDYNDWITLKSGDDYVSFSKDQSEPSVRKRRELAQSWIIESVIDNHEGVVKSGDLVHLRTTENSLNKKLYVSFPTQLRSKVYYYKLTKDKEFKWKITKQGGSVGDAIAMGDKIALESINYDDYYLAFDGESVVGKKEVTYLAIDEYRMKDA